MKSHAHLLSTFIHFGAFSLAFAVTATALRAHSVWIEDTAAKQLVVRFGELGGEIEASPGHLDSLSLPVAWRRPTAAESAGAWSQAVFQVYDSPRYEAFGRWEHRGNPSVCEPADANGEARFVAAEIGLDRYERITTPSLAADEYWRKKGAYWAAVRRAWVETFAHYDRFTLIPEVGGKKLFEQHFEFAEKLAAGQPADSAAAGRHAQTTIATFLQPKLTHAP